MAVISYVGFTLGAIGILGTLLPLVPNGKPIFRIWDFPRSQVAAVLVLALAVAAPGLTLEDGLGGFYFAVLLGCLVWQCSRILPYTPLFSVQAQAGGAVPMTEASG